MTSCTAPLTFETLVAYWAGDLDAAETERVDTHLFGCGTCTAASARVASVSETLRALGPPIIDAKRLADLRARGRVIEDNVVAPGETSRVTFAGQDFVVHHLGGLALAGAERVSIVVRVVETGDVILDQPSVPFDVTAGEVLVACQRHFAAFPPNVLFEVTPHDAAGPRATARYVVEHAFVR